MFFKDKYAISTLKSKEFCCQEGTLKKLSYCEEPGIFITKGIIV